MVFNLINVTVNIRILHVLIGDGYILGVAESERRVPNRLRLIAAGFSKSTTPDGTVRGLGLARLRHRRTHKPVVIELISGRVRCGFL